MIYNTYKITTRVSLIFTLMFNVFKTRQNWQGTLVSVFLRALLNIARYIAIYMNVLNNDYLTPPYYMLLLRTLIQLYAIEVIENINFTLLLFFSLIGICLLSKSKIVENDLLQKIAFSFILQENKYYFSVWDLCDKHCDMRCDMCKIVVEKFLLVYIVLLWEGVLLWICFSRQRVKN